MAKEIAKTTDLAAILAGENMDILDMSPEQINKFSGLNWVEKGAPVDLQPGQGIMGIIEDIRPIESSFDRDKEFGVIEIANAITPENTYVISCNSVLWPKVKDAPIGAMILIGCTEIAHSQKYNKDYKNYRVKIVENRGE